MSLHSTEAIVLSTLRLGEADKLITFFSLTRGKVAGVARGARRFKNRFGAALEPFTQCHLVFFEKGGTLLRVRQADIVHSFQKLRDEWDTIDLGTQMVRLVLAMTPDAQPHPALYHLLVEAFAFLETGVDRKLSWILFMAHLIRESGYQPRWNSCVQCNQIIKLETLNGRTLSFSHKEGGVFCPRCVTADPMASALSMDALAFLQAVSSVDFRSAHYHAIPLLVRREVETILNDYLGWILPAKRMGMR
jgi:DNA repair protein RecO (recombination protein O)